MSKAASPPPNLPPATTKPDGAGTTPCSRIPPGHRVPAHLARRFQQICLGIASEATQPAGLTPVEFALLAALDDTPDIDQGSLAALIGMDVVSAHHILHRLEGAGLVERRVAADRRARALRLTPRGHMLRQDLRPATRAVQERILAPLSPAERPVFVDMLTRLVEAHEAYARPGNGRRRPQPSRFPPNEGVQT